MILIHGNYNWFNLLIMVLTLSLIDDEFIFGNEPVRISPLNRILNLNVLVVMLVLVFKTFELKLGGNHWIDWKISRLSSIYFHALFYCVTMLKRRTQFFMPQHLFRTNSTAG